jgi:hypothetical protein
MSSVFLGLLSFGYGQWRDHKSNQQKREQLDIEIALRFQAMDSMCSSSENVRYSNLVNVDRVIEGDPKASFYVRKPIFSEFQNKSITTLLWQLYLVAPDKDRDEIKRDIQDMNDVVARIRKVRYAAVQDLGDDDDSKRRTKKEQEEQDDRDDKFKRDYGQTDIYRRIHSLAQSDRWGALVF